LVEHDQGLSPFIQTGYVNAITREKKTLNVTQITGTPLPVSQVNVLGRIDL
jgi:hypothetical protein